VKDVRLSETFNPYHLRTAVERYRRVNAEREAADARVRDELAAWAGTTRQRDVANALGISAQYLSDVLNNRRGLSADLVERIERAAADPGVSCEVRESKAHRR
jgi:hypothetical protein